MTTIHPNNECSLPDCFCHVAQRLERERSDAGSSASSSESAVAVPPTFTEEWESAPRAMIRYVEQSIAEYWFLRGVRAGETAATIAINGDLKELRRVAAERIEQR